MRKVIVCNIMSLDGCYTGGDGDVMVMPMDATFDRFNVEHMRAATTLLVGRKSYEGFRSYWPPVEHQPGESADNREISRRWKETELLVVSDTLTPAPGSPMTANTSVVGRSAAASHVAKLKEADGGDILIFGSHTTWTALLLAGVVDELHLMVGCALVGDGRRMFGPAPGVTLTLLGVTTSTGSGNVVLRYAVATGHALP
jgi:dihydrofolate reductase